MRIIIKGGVWKNTEDEILKAAVSKYGKNQWARISSLLVRKSPKQCKARWYEWLDPSIKKTEWSKEEDEKLLHLAKLMPTQWRTIAPIVGRTPAQCLERYQKLLDEAEARESIVGGLDLGLTGVTGPESAPSADEVRRLRPGEIDPDPETKPARPDPVDMDEDEKEMLSEARARLANTQGKKAKRKARERQLEEARRLASLQKRRELKAAGIELKVKKKKGIDYNIDIPLEKKPAIGFYDTTEELSKPKDPHSLTGVHLQKLEKRLNDDDDDKKKAKKRKQENKDGVAPSFVPAAANAQLQKLKEAEQISKRRKLVLPTPQVGEGELEEIVKIGLTGESARSMVDGNDNQATRGLLGNYSVTPANMSVRTPRTPAALDNVMLEARNLRNLTVAQTPLLGDENTPFHPSQGGTGFEGATPQRIVQQTPNPMMTPLRGEAGKPGSAAGRLSQTPLRTPFRDELSINGQDGGFGETPREERMRRISQKHSLRQGLMNLPVPKNDFEIVIPDVDAKKGDLMEMVIEEDMSDVDRRNKEIRAAAEEARLARRSTAVKRDLPRPISFDAKKLVFPSGYVGEGDLSAANHLIDEEMVRLIKHDSLKYPAIGSNIAPGSVGDIEDLEAEFEDDLIERARELLEEEFKKIELHEDIIELEELWDRTHGELAFAPSVGKFVGVDEIGMEERIKGLEKMLDTNRASMTQDAVRAQKLEKKLSVHLGGYQSRSRSLQQKICETFDELDQTFIELSSYELLQVGEKGAIPRRVESLETEFEFLAKREKNLQSRYKELTERKEAAIMRMKVLEEAKTRKDVKDVAG